MDTLSLVAIIFVAIGVGFGIAQLVLIRLDPEGRRNAPQRIYDRLPEAVIGLDRHGSIRSLNQSAQDLFRCDEQSVRGRPLGCLIRGAGFGGSNPHWEQIRTGGGILTEAIRRDGGIFPARCIPLGDSMILVKEETTELLASAFRMFSSPVLIASREGRVVAANPACDSVFGKPAPSGTGLSELFPGADIRTRNTIKLQHKDSGFVFTAQQTPDGYLLLFGGKLGPLRSVENLMTEISAYTELLLLSIDRDSPIREDLERILAASREAVAVLPALSGRAAMAAGR